MNTTEAAEALDEAARKVLNGYQYINTYGIVVRQIAPGELRIIFAQGTEEAAAKMLYAAADELAVRAAQHKTVN